MDEATASEQLIALGVGLMVALMMMVGMYFSGVTWNRATVFAEQYNDTMVVEEEDHGRGNKTD